MVWRKNGSARTRQSVFLSMRAGSFIDRYDFRI